MASPRTTWTGTITLGLLSLPVTLGKAVADPPKAVLKDYCADHLMPVDRSWRCPGDDTCALPNKTKGVADDQSKVHVLSSTEMQQIAANTKADTLAILDAQPLIDFPMWAAEAVYYVRFNTKVKGAPVRHFATLIAALEQQGYGAVAKWCSEERQRLVVLHVKDSVLHMTVLPTLDRVREPGDMESAHHGETVDPAEVGALVQLLDATANPQGFDWSSYEDEGARLRDEAVERLLQGSGGTPAPIAASGSAVPDLMATLTASIEATQKKGGDIETPAPNASQEVTA